MQFCCKEMSVLISDSREPIKYNKVFREYYIKSFRKYNIIAFEYCPWCGTKLTKALRNEFFDTLENEYHIETDIGEYKNEVLPEEFKTDEWWKKRGL